MIKFFRNIRKKLLAEGNTGKYLKYAIGEIVLVVIGILIALQINNWNENSQVKAFEHKMLVEIKNALDSDIDFFENHLKKRTQRERTAREFFENYFITNLINEDSIDYHYDKLHHSIQVTYNKGPYEALKSTGIDKVQSDSLRNAIIDLYEFKLPRYAGLIEKSIRVSDTHMLDLYKNLSKKTTFTINNSNQISYKRGLGNINLKENSDFLNLLEWSERSESIIAMLNTSITHMENIVITIKTELEK